MELIFVAVWLLAGLAHYRYVGFSIENQLHKGHEFQSICSSCRCKNCGETHGHHYRYRILSATKCDDFEFAMAPHIRTLVALPPTVALWPLVTLMWAALAARKKLGITGGFFIAPPMVESRDERAARVEAERIADMERREAAIEEAEKRLEIGPYRKV